MARLSGRLRLAPAFLVSAIGVALVLYMSPARAGSTVNPAPARAVNGVAITVSDMDRAVAFYSTVLFFEMVSDVRSSGPEVDSLFGMRGAGVRVVTMRLGAERIELVQDLGRDGHAMPADAGSADHALQHIAIAVNDMDQAYLWLHRHHVEQTSPVPPLQPELNPGARGVRTFAFADPDGYALEIVQFPAGKGDARWQRPSDRVFLGIDHTAIVVRNTEQSLRFYRDALGLRVVSGSESPGRGHERLNDAAGAPARVTTLRAAKGAEIELVEHPAARDGRPDPRAAMASDVVRSRTLLVTGDAVAAATRIGSSTGGSRPIVVAMADAPLGFRRGLAVDDPDGHGIQVRSIK